MQPFLPTCILFNIAYSTHEIIFAFLQRTKQPLYIFSAWWALLCLNILCRFGEKWDFPCQLPIKEKFYICFKYLFWFDKTQLTCGACHKYLSCASHWLSYRSPSDCLMIEYTSYILHARKDIIARNRSFFKTNFLSNLNIDLRI